MTKELVNDPLAVYKIVANETNNVDVALEVQKVFPRKKTREKLKNYFLRKFVPEKLNTYVFDKQIGLQKLV